MSSIWTESRFINYNRLNDETEQHVNSQEELRTDLEQILGGFGARKVTDARLQPVFLDPTKMLTTDPERETMINYEDKPFQMATDFIMKTYPGSVIKQSALIQGFYNMRFFEELWNHHQRQWKLILQSKDPVFIENMIDINDEYIIIKDLFETTPIIWTMKYGDDFTAINIMTTFGITLSQHPEINPSQLGQSIINFMDVPGRKLKDVKFDNLTAIACGQKYEIQIIEKDDAINKHHDQQKIILRMRKTQIGVKVQNKEGPIIKIQMSTNLQSRILNEYTEIQRMTIKAKIMAKQLNELSDRQDNPVQEVCDSLKDPAQARARRTKELETDLANMRKPRTTSTDIKIIVTSKTNTIRPLNKQDIVNQRHIVFWIGKSMPKIVDKWNVWYTIHIEIKKNGYCDTMERINEFGVGTFAVNANQTLTALPSIQPYQPWDGQIATRAAIRNDYFRNILQPLQRIIESRMNHIQKITLVEDDEVWSIKIDWMEGKIEIYEITQLMINASRYKQNWRQRMLCLAQKQGIFDHTNGNYEMEPKRNTNYEGYYSSTSGPKPNVIEDENRYWMEREMQKQYQNRVNVTFSLPITITPRNNNQTQRNNIRYPTSTSPGVERRMSLYKASAQRPMPNMTITTNVFGDLRRANRRKLMLNTKQNLSQSNPMQQRSVLLLTQKPAETSDATHDID